MKRARVLHAYLDAACPPANPHNGDHAVQWPLTVRPEEFEAGPLLASPPSDGGAPP